MSRGVADGILLRACLDTGMSLAEIKDRRREQRVVRTRQAVAYAIRTRTGMSYPRIAALIGLTDHTTIIHACKLVERLIPQGGEFAAMVERLMEAPEIPVTTIRAMLGKQGIEDKNFSPPRKVSRGRYRKSPLFKTEAQAKKSAEPTAIRVSAPPAPPPPKVQVWESVALPGLNPFSLNEDGETRSDIKWRGAMAAGSRALAQAIIQSRFTQESAA